jgi:pimeloyl-ACP methyl ester carboxylesterase
MSEDINELAASLGIKDFFLAGHSMGGKVAMTFACRYPLLVKGLIVADISPFSEQPERESAFDQHQNILKAIIETDLSEAVKRENIENQLSVHIESEKIRGLIMKSLERTGPESFRWRLNAAALMNNLGNIIGDIPVAGEDFNEITGFPVIFLKGEKSDYISPHNFKKALRLFPGAELRVIRNAGHWLHVNNPDAVIAAFNDLLNY